MKTISTMAGLMLAATFVTSASAAESTPFTTAALAPSMTIAVVDDEDGGRSNTASVASPKEEGAGAVATKQPPNIVDLFLSKKNPMVQMVLAMNEACPSDVLGLMRDVGELVGLAEPPQLQLPEGGSFGDKMRALAEQRNAAKSLLDRMLSRSCLYNRLFGDGTCGK